MTEDPELIEDGGVQGSASLGDRWDEIKQRESFVAIGALIAVALTPWIMVRAPITSDIIQGYSALPPLIMIYGIVVLGFNLLLGYLKLVSFGHAAFFGGAAYAAGILSNLSYGSPILMVVVGVVAATLLAWVIGFLSIRRGGVYFAVLTLTFGQMMYFWSQGPGAWLTNGSDGYTAVQTEPLLGMIDIHGEIAFFGSILYLFIGGLTVLTVIVTYRILNSPYGLILKAIGQNEQRVNFVGLNVWRYKLMAFILSGAFAGLGGALFTIHESYVPLGSLYWVQSGDFVIMTALGGAGTVVGPVLGAAVFAWTEFVLSGFPLLGNFWLLILGLIFATVVWLFSDGLWGLITSIGKRIRAAVESGGEN